MFLSVQAAVLCNCGPSQDDPHHHATRPDAGIGKASGVGHWRSPEFLRVWSSRPIKDHQSIQQLLNKRVFWFTISSLEFSHFEKHPRLHTWPFNDLSHLVRQHVHVQYQYDWIHPPSPIAANKETLQAGSLQALHRSFELQASLRGKLLLLATTSGANHDAAARDAAVFDRALPHSDSYFVIILFSIPDYARRTCDSIKARLETLCGGYHLLQWLSVFIDLFWCGALLVFAHCSLMFETNLGISMWFHEYSQAPIQSRCKESGQYHTWPWRLPNTAEQCHMVDAGRTWQSTGTLCVLCSASVPFCSLQVHLFCAHAPASAKLRDCCHPIRCVQSRLEQPKDFSISQYLGKNKSTTKWGPKTDVASMQSLLQTTQGPALKAQAA